MRRTDAAVCVGRDRSRLPVRAIQDALQLHLIGGVDRLARLYVRAGTVELGGLLFELCAVGVELGLGDAPAFMLDEDDETKCREAGRHQGPFLPAADDVSEKRHDSAGGTDDMPVWRNGAEECGQTRHRPASITANQRHICRT